MNKTTARKQRSEMTKDEFLMHFFVQVLVLIQQAPDSLLADLEQAIHQVQSERRKQDEQQ